MQPEDLLDELGVKPGESREGVKFAKNMCPSQGTMDIFVEPVLPRPVADLAGLQPGGDGACRTGSAARLSCHGRRPARRVCRRFPTPTC